jgi:hypothetical protein
MKVGANPTQRTRNQTHGRIFPRITENFQSIFHGIIDYLDCINTPISFLTLEFRHSTPPTYIVL